MAKRRRKPRTLHPKHLALTITAGILAASALAGCDSRPASAKAPICAPRASVPGSAGWDDPDGCWERRPDGRTYYRTTFGGYSYYHAEPPGYSRYSDASLGGFTPPEFHLAKDIYSGGPLGSPFFWGRFDMFERAGGGLAVLEYNCDKPAGQREIWASGDVGPTRGNPNRHARARFRHALARAWRLHSRGARPRPRLAILADPAHREEFRLAYLFGGEASALGWTWDVVGPDNLAADDGTPSAYGERVDIVLRQYPAEYLHELPAAAALLEAVRDGRLLWLNDPRAVVAQSKSMFAALWALVRGGQWLTRREAALVQRAVPPTGLASQPGWLDRARSRPEDWVLKPVLGRYSERVAAGAMATSTEW